MVSIVVPVYNVEKYLPVCIESLINQTYKDIEILLVNDGSTDGSLKILREYESRDSRIKVLDQKNKGLSAARNTGVNNSTGEYIFFVDSDDCIDARLVEIAVMVAEAAGEKGALVQLNLKFVPEDFVPEKLPSDSVPNQITIFDDKLKIENKEYEIRYFDAVTAFYNLDRDNKKLAEDIRLTTTVAWTKLYRRAVFKELSFPEEVRLHEDQMTAHRRIQQAKGMTFVDIPLYYYRQADNSSLIRVGWTKKRLSILDCYEDRLATAKELADNQEFDNCVETSKGLLDFIYLRTLVCFFRNYAMTSKNKSIDSNEKREIQKSILIRMKKILNDRTGKLSFAKAVFFKTFVLMPLPFVIAFNIRNK